MPSQRLSKETLEKLYWQDGKSTPVIARELGYIPGAIWYWMKKFGIPTRPRNVKPNLTPSADLCYVIGVLKGDGCTYLGKRKCEGVLTLAQIRQEFAQSFEKALRNIGMHPHTDLRPPSKSNFIVSKKWLYRTRANSIEFVKWYRSLSLEKIEEVVRKNRVFTREFIRGFYESEGCNCFNVSKYRVWLIEIINKDDALLKMVDTFLKDLGFAFRWHKRRGGIYDSVIYDLVSTRSRQNHRFMEEIAPCIKSKTPTPN